jgi:hypothetical protein
MEQLFIQAKMDYREYKKVYRETSMYATEVEKGLHKDG